MSRKISCLKCKEKKPESEFYKSKRNGFQAYCKQCKKEYVQKNMDHILRKQRQRYRKYNVLRETKRAFIKRRRIEFYNFLRKNGACELCNSQEDLIIQFLDNDEENTVIENISVVCKEHLKREG